MSLLTGRPGILLADSLSGHSGRVRPKAHRLDWPLGLLGGKICVSDLPRGSDAPEVAVGDDDCRPNRGDAD
jgi:hypothetical protein